MHTTVLISYPQLVILVRMDKIFKFVEVHTGLTKDSFITKSRRSETLLPRGLFVCIARKLNISFPIIGEALGGRDHTTIIHTYQKYRTDPTIEHLVQRYINENGSDLRQEGTPVKLSGRYAWLHEKFEGKCLVCSFDEVVECHHILPRRLGGDDSPNNLVLLCPNHHALADRGMLSIKDINSRLISRTYPTYPHP